MIIVTATEKRPDIAELWHKAVSQTLLDPHEVCIFYQIDKPKVLCDSVKIPHLKQGAMLFLINKVLPENGIRMYLEEDIIPVRSWSVNDYPGELLYAEGWPGVAWPAFYLARGRRYIKPSIVKQRYIRDGGCPDWLPRELCELALEANAKVLGDHFLHIDKAYKNNISTYEAKKNLLNKLIKIFN